MVWKNLARATLLAAAMAPGAVAAPASAPVPRYSHIFVIIEENHNFDQVVGQKIAPNFNRLAKHYGLATNFYAERHPSEPNYIAILGGDTFGIQDDNPFFCKPNPQFNSECDEGNRLDYVDHTITARSLVDQLDDHGLSWKGYFESIPAPGSGEARWPSDEHVVPGKPGELYAVKHNGFMSFKTVQDDPKRAEKIVGFDVLMADLKNGTVPNYAHIVPDQCDDMHGLAGEAVPEDCDKDNDPGRIARADAQLGRIVDAITKSSVWQAADNSAIVITFDENDTTRSDTHNAGCCGSVPGDRNNPGGGWIPTAVITNHGPRGITDPTPYNHYSLLRTTEDAFGISEHLGHAADDAKGVIDMAPLFAVSKS